MNSQAETILLVEDDLRLADLTKRYLEENGFKVVIENGDRALSTFDRIKPKLVILDLMLPGKNGVDICKDLRATFTGPIMMLTAKDTSIDQVIGLESGADDYITKPVDPIVLVARIRSLLRRLNTPISEQAIEEIEFGGFKIIPSSQRVWLNEVEIPLSTQEFSLLQILAQNAGKILSRESLFKMTRGIDYDGLDRSVDVRISKLRKKLEDDTSEPFRIKTIWGKGYLFVPDAWG